MIEDARSEGQRHSRYLAMMEMSEQYNAMLRTSMQSFNLPTSYITQLVAFGERTVKRKPRKYRTGCRSALDHMKKNAVSQLVNYSGTELHQLKENIHRQTFKLKDLNLKSNLARRQLEFCQETRDPSAPKFAGQEGVLRDMAQALEKTLAGLQEKCDVAHTAFQGGIKSATELSLSLPPSATEMEVVVAASIQKHRDFIEKAPRPPLTNLCFDSRERTARPSKFYTDDTPFRAVAAAKR